MEILLHNAAGYSILMAINESFIVFSGLSVPYRIGYYLGYLRELAKKLNCIILTEDSDFGEWVFAHDIKDIGVIFVRYKQVELVEISESIIRVLSKYNDNLFYIFIIHFMIKDKSNNKKEDSNDKINSLLYYIMIRIIMILNTRRLACTI